MQAIRQGHRVRVLRDIRRFEGPYAFEGEEGIVLETFRPPSSAANLLGPWYAKAQIGTQIKTLRLTSLERL
jgi:hypothetical protein